MRVECSAEERTTFGRLSPGDTFRQSDFGPVLIVVDVSGQIFGARLMDGFCYAIGRDDAVRRVDGVFVVGRPS